MAFLKRRGFAIAYLIVVLALVAGLRGLQVRSENKLEEAAARTQRILYEGSVAGCERGNTLRSVVYEVTELAVNTKQGALFEDQLIRLKAQPYFRKDGTIDCLAAIDKP